MMEKSAQPDEGRECTLTPFTLPTITFKVELYALAERAQTLPLFLLYPYLYSVRRPTARAESLQHAGFSNFRQKIISRNGVQSD